MLEEVEPMGRGRAKAKQVKVARQLKYSGGGTDLDRLRAELGVDADTEHANGDSAYADLGDRYGTDDDSALEDDDDDEDEDWDSDDGFGEHSIAGAQGR
jgi:preprotein translocase subunit Sec63